MPANTSPPNSQGWSSSCVGTLVGETCEAACLSTATGKILATCNEDKTWTVTGTCEGWHVALSLETACLLGFGIAAAAGGVLLWLNLQQLACELLFGSNYGVCWQAAG